MPNCEQAAGYFFIKNITIFGDARFSTERYNYIAALCGFGLSVIVEKQTWRGCLLIYILAVFHFS